MADGFDHAVLGQAPPCTFHEQFDSPCQSRARAGLAFLLQNDDKRTRRWRNEQTTCLVRMAKMHDDHVRFPALSSGGSSCISNVSNLTNRAAVGTGGIAMAADIDGLDKLVAESSYVF